MFSIFSIRPEFGSGRGLLLLEVDGSSLIPQVIQPPKNSEIGDGFGGLLFGLLHFRTTIILALQGEFESSNFMWFM